MERKRHLDSGKCEGVPPDPSVATKKIVKNDNDVYVFKKCNTEIRHRILVDILKFVKLKKYRNRNIHVIYVKRFFHSNLNLKDT